MFDSDFVVSFVSVENILPSVGGNIWNYIAGQL